MHGVFIFFCLPGVMVFLVVWICSTFVQISMISVEFPNLNYGYAPNRVPLYVAAALRQTPPGRSAAPSVFFARSGVCRAIRCFTVPVPMSEPQGLPIVPEVVSDLYRYLLSIFHTHRSQYLDNLCKLKWFPSVSCGSLNPTEAFPIEVSVRKYHLRVIVVCQCYRQAWAHNAVILDAWKCCITAFRACGGGVQGVRTWLVSPFSRNVLFHLAFSLYLSRVLSNV